MNNSRLEEERFAGEISKYQLSSKLFAMNIGDTVEHNNSVLQNNPPVISTIPTCDSSIISPKHVSEELLSIERMDRLLKIRRRRQSSNDRRIHCSREHSYNPNEGPVPVISKSFPLWKTFLYTERTEYNLPEASSIFLPTADELSDPDFVYRSKFSLKRRLKRRNNRPCGFIG